MPFFCAVNFYGVGGGHYVGPAALADYLCADGFALGSEGLGESVFFARL